MTKEELKKEAKESWWNDNNCSGGLPTEKIYECGYLAGAEPREKRIAKLEETNNELKGKLMLSDMVLTDKTKRIKELEDKLMDKVCLESLDIVSAKIKELEKENAELKDNFKIAKDNEYEYSSLLTKATEVIEGLMRFCRCFAQHHTEDIRYKDAEQFLKEVKEK